MRSGQIFLTVEMICQMVSFLQIDLGHGCYYLAIGTVRTARPWLGYMTLVDEGMHGQHFQVFSLFLSFDWLVVAGIGRCPLIPLGLLEHVLG